MESDSKEKSGSADASSAKPRVKTFQDRKFRALNYSKLYRSKYHFEAKERYYYPFWTAISAVIHDFDPVEQNAKANVYCQVWYEYPGSEKESLDKYFDANKAYISKTGLHEKDDNVRSLKLPAGASPNVNFFFPLNESVMFEHAEGRATYLQANISHNVVSNFLYAQFHVVVKLPVLPGHRYTNPFDRAYIPFELMTKREAEFSVQGQDTKKVQFTWKAFELWGSWRKAQEKAKEQDNKEKGKEQDNKTKAKEQDNKEGAKSGSKRGEGEEKDEDPDGQENDEQVSAKASQSGGQGSSQKEDFGRNRNVRNRDDEEEQEMRAQVMLLKEKPEKEESGRDRSKTYSLPLKEEERTEDIRLYRSAKKKDPNKKNYKKMKERMKAFLPSPLYGDDLEIFSLRKEQSAVLGFYKVLRPTWYEDPQSCRPVFLVCLQNRGWHFCANYQVPVFLLVNFVLLTAWFQVRRSNQPEGLIQASFLCVAGIIAVKFVMASNLPKIAILTLGDKYITLSFFFPVFALAIGVYEELAEPNVDYALLELIIYGLILVWIFLVNLPFVVLVAVRTTAASRTDWTEKEAIAVFSEFKKEARLGYDGRKHYMPREEKKPDGGGSAATTKPPPPKPPQVEDESIVKYEQKNADTQQSTKKEEESGGGSQPKDEEPGETTVVQEEAGKDEEIDNKKKDGESSGKKQQESALPLELVSDGNNVSGMLLLDTVVYDNFRGGGIEDGGFGDVIDANGKLRDDSNSSILRFDQPKNPKVSGAVVTKLV